jgi:Fe-S-cluster containining protein
VIYARHRSARTRENRDDGNLSAQPARCQSEANQMRPCTQCGKCCEKYGAGSGLGSATEADLERLDYRPDVLRYISLGDLWISPVTGEETRRCPWLRKLPNQDKFKCRIHDVRPDVCRNYPVDVEQMIRDGCEMLEEADLTKPRAQLQRELKRLRNEPHG